MFYLTNCEWSVDRERSLALEYRILKTLLGTLPRFEGLKFKLKLFLSNPTESLYLLVLNDPDTEVPGHETIYAILLKDEVYKIFQILQIRQTLKIFPSKLLVYDILISI